MQCYHPSDRYRRFGKLVERKTAEQKQKERFEAEEKKRKDKEQHLAEIREQLIRRQDRMKWRNEARNHFQKERGTPWDQERYEAQERLKVCLAKMAQDKSRKKSKQIGWVDAELQSKWKAEMDRWKDEFDMAHQLDPNRHEMTRWYFADYIIQLHRTQCMPLTYNPEWRGVCCQDCEDEYKKGEFWAEVSRLRSTGELLEVELAFRE